MCAAFPYTPTMDDTGCVAPRSKRPSTGRCARLTVHGRTGYSGVPRAMRRDERRRCILRTVRRSRRCRTPRVPWLHRARATPIPHRGQATRPWHARTRWSNPPGRVRRRRWTAVSPRRSRRTETAETPAEQRRPTSPPRSCPADPSRGPVNIARRPMETPASPTVRRTRNSAPKSRGRRGRMDDEDQEKRARLAASCSCIRWLPEFTAPIRLCRTPLSSACAAFHSFCLTWY